MRRECPATNPYSHRIAHSLEKQRPDMVPVVFTSPNELVGFISSINTSNDGTGHMHACGKAHVISVVSQMQERRRLSDPSPSVILRFIVPSAVAHQSLVGLKY